MAATPATVYVADLVFLFMAVLKEHEPLAPVVQPPDPALDHVPDTVAPPVGASPASTMETVSVAVQPPFRAAPLPVSDATWTDPPPVAAVTVTSWLTPPVWPAVSVTVSATG